MREVGALEPNLPDCARVRSGKVRWRADSVYRLEPLAGARSYGPEATRLRSQLQSGGRSLTLAATT